MQLGPWGENLAVRELERIGYRVVATNFRTRRGEIDIVAWHCRTLVFVEVKTRRCLRYGTPAAAVHPAKQRRLRLLARLWMSRHREPADGYRFDVVSIVVGNDESQPEIEVLPHAF